MSDFYDGFEPQTLLVQQPNYETTERMREGIQTMDKSRLIQNIEKRIQVLKGCRNGWRKEGKAEIAEGYRFAVEELQFLVDWLKCPVAE